MVSALKGARPGHPYADIVFAFAFQKVLEQVPDARLRMVGEGKLLDPCRDLVDALQMNHAVSFLGSQPHRVVADEMKRARAFTQHSIEASNGDCEGAPLAILEAGASGLPVVSTHHAGIPEVVLHEDTGYIVEEKDIEEQRRSGD